MKTLVLAEHDNSTLSPHTARTLTAALALGGPVHILVAGEACSPAAIAASHLDGVQEILVVDHASLADQGPEAVSALIMALAPDYEAILAPATARGKSALPRVAALLDVAQISDIVAIVSEDTFRRPVYAGNAIETLRSADPVKVITVRTTAFAAVGPAASPAPIRKPAVGTQAYAGSIVVGQSLVASDFPELAAARVVVSGGRAFKSRENFESLLFPLAQKLGAAVGASRAAVDAGFASNDLQVGQTGQMVAPDLYIACGISGAIQHLAGMKQSKVIVAINSDPDAPIFEIADYGLVGDLFDVLPTLTGKL